MRAGIVTGAASGIGAATARLLAEEGARLVLADVSEAGLEPVADDVRAASGEAQTVTVDVRSFADTQAMADRCRDAYGRIDFVVAAAGIAEGSTMADGDPARWAAILETNVLGVAHTARSVLPAMRDQGSGDVILIASISGRITYVGEPIYLASKWAVVGLGYALREEALEYGVRVTLIEPGLVETPLSRGTPLGREGLASTTPLSPEDVARATAFALSQPPHAALTELAIRPLREE